jgi:hypothetical protein
VNPQPLNSTPPVEIDVWVSQVRSQFTSVFPMLFRSMSATERVASQFDPMGWVFARYHRLEPAEIMMARDVGLDLFHYTLARVAGLPASVACEAQRCGVDVLAVAAAMAANVDVEGGPFFTYDELLQAATAGVHPYLYGLIRTGQVTHDEVLAAHTEGVSLVDYRASRSAGLDHHALMLEVRGAWVEFTIRAMAAQARVSSTELESVYGHTFGPSIDVFGYLNCRREGISHADAFDAICKLSPFDPTGLGLGYRRSRQAGASHDQILEAAAGSADLVAYGWQRSRRTGHLVSMVRAAHPAMVNNRPAAADDWAAIVNN